MSLPPAVPRSPLVRRLRLAAAATCVAIGGAAATQGACLASGDGGITTPPPETVSLAPRYVLALIGGAAPPRMVRQDADGTVIRLHADTITFAPGGTALTGTFDEVAWIGTTRVGQAETLQRVVLDGQRYSREAGSNLNLETHAALAGRPVFGSVTPNGPGATVLSLFGPGAALRLDGRP